MQLGVLLTAVWAMATIVSILRRGGPEAMILGSGLTLACGLVLFEVLMLLGILPRWWRTLSPYTSLLFVSSFGIFLASLFLRRQRQLLQLELERGLANRRLGEQGALLAAAARMAKGDLQSPIMVSNNGELAPLEGAVEGMRQDLQVQIRHLDSMQQELQIKVTELQTSNREVQQLNEELRRQIEQRSRRLLEILLPKEGPQPSGTELPENSLLGDCYRVVRSIGRGGMGVVYEVERTTDGRRLAAKVLGSNPDRTALGRFAREAQILARLCHPNLISIFDIDVTSHGLLFIAMELVDGSSLWQLRAGFGDKDPRWGLAVLRQVAAALAALHGQGIVHRGLLLSSVSVGESGI
jgi:tRNA A-37 threonylcarbamoyl transferase component Bud32